MRIKYTCKENLFKVGDKCRLNLNHPDFKEVMKEAGLLTDWDKGEYPKEFDGELVIIDLDSTWNKIPTFTIQAERMQLWFFPPELLIKI